MNTKQPPTRLQLLRIFRAWLTESGYAYCTTGRHVVSAENMARTHPYRCKACVAAKTARWYATPAGRAKSKVWFAANADKRREYMRRYMRHHRG